MPSCRSAGICCRRKLLAGGVDIVARTRPIRAIIEIASRVDVASGAPSCNSPSNTFSNLNFRPPDSNRRNHVVASEAAVAAHVGFSDSPTKRPWSCPRQQPRTRRTAAV